MCSDFFWLAAQVNVSAAFWTCAGVCAFAVYHSRRSLTPPAFPVPLPPSLPPSLPPTVCAWLVVVSSHAFLVQLSFFLFYNCISSTSWEVWVAFHGKDDQPQEQRHPACEVSVVYLSTDRDVSGFDEVGQDSRELPLHFFDFQLPRDL